MTTLTHTFTAPAVLGPSPALTAGIEYGRRSLWWTQLQPGKIGQCRYHMLWAQVSEDRMRAGEATTCWAQRRAAEGWARSALTPNAATILRHELLAAVNQYGFDRLWTETNRAGSVAVDAAVSAVESARRQLAWAEATLTVRHMHEAGMTEARPIAADPSGRCRSTVLGYQNGRETWLPCVAELWSDGWQVGWLDDHGYALPLRQENPEKSVQPA